jgi:hypothetical protein
MVDGVLRRIRVTGLGIGTYLLGRDAEHDRGQHHRLLHAELVAEGDGLGDLVGRAAQRGWTSPVDLVALEVVEIRLELGGSGQRHADKHRGDQRSRQQAADSHRAFLLREVANREPWSRDLTSRCGEPSRRFSGRV